VFASSILCGSSDKDGDYYVPGERILDLLGRYSLPVRKFRALDLRVCLDLFDREAVRCLRVPANISFDNLHRLLQKAFGWRNRHLHSFGMFKEWNSNPYGKPDIELFTDEGSFDINPEAMPASGKTLADFVPEYNKILYNYDFGDDWRHYIEVENIIEGCEEKLPRLFSGEGDAPPKDVGGSGGFANFLEVIANPSHEEYEHMKSWSESQRWKPFDFEWVASTIK